MLSLVKDSQIAKDIVQDAFVKVWLKRSIVGRTANFRAYLYKILRNAVMDWFDSVEINRRYVASQTLNVAEYVDYTEQKIDADELMLLIFEALGRMPERRRRVFMMSRYECMANEDIALSLGIDRRTVENHLTNALADIRCYIAAAM